ncbi:MAG: type I phosphomannose isomerase catalytic subunit, partial [Candidatus Hydrogenedens sp.]
EAWLISDREEYQSSIMRGPLKGKKINEVINTFPEFIFGTEKISPFPKKFPLLLKLIDANELLSVQVHPDDQKAKKFGEHDSGKTEMWYILDAKPNSFIYLGLKKNVRKEHLINEIQHHGDVDRLLNKIYVKTGDHYLIPAGTVHAIGPGILLAEIQQNSNVTYRLYDWNRVDSTGKPRLLHIDKAMETIQEEPIIVRARKIEKKHIFGVEKYLCSCPYFIAKYWEIKKECQIWDNNYSFHIVLSLSDTNINIFDEDINLRSGESLLIPAKSNNYVIFREGIFLDYYQL